MTEAAHPPSDKRAEKDLVSMLAYSPELWDCAEHLTPDHFTDKQAKSVFEQMQDKQSRGRTWIVLDDFPFLPVVSLSELQVEEIVKRLNELHYRRQHYFRAQFEVRAALEGDIEKLQELSAKDLPNLTGYVNGRTQYTAAEFVKVEFPPDRYLVEGLIRARGVNVLAGDFGSGKTTASVDEAIGIAGGTSAWGRKCTKGEVLYLGLDNPQEDLQELLTELCEGREEPVPDGITFDFSPLDLSDGASFPYLREQILQWEYNLVLFDVIGRYMGSFDENSNSDVGKINAAFRAITNETGAAFQPNHHMSKQGSPANSKSLIDRVRGAGDWVGGSDIAHAMTKKGLGSEIIRTLVPLKIRRAPEENGISFTIETPETGGLALAFSRADPSIVKDTKKNIAAGIMLQSLKTNEGEIFLKSDLESDLANAGIDLADRTLGAAYAELMEHPHVLRAKQGRFATYQFDPLKEEQKDIA